jgi:hypothetical protein
MSSYERKLDQLLDVIFARFGGLSYPKLSAKSGLAISTIYNIDMRITRLPRLKTIFALARVAKMDIQLVAREVQRAQ